MAKEIATFAGGCFWCMVKPFDSQPGIESVISGYTGGHKENPTYKEVCSGTTGHTEAVQITFDPEVFPYEKLVEILVIFFCRIERACRLDFCHDLFFESSAGLQGCF